MKKVLIAVLVAVTALTLSCKSTDTGSKSGAGKAGKVKDGPGKILWEGDGSLKGSGNFKNYKKEGEWNLFHRYTGEKLAAGNYKDDKQSGRWTYFYKNGQKMTEGEFDEDQRTGAWVEFHEKGEKKSEMSYIIINKVFPELGVTERMGVLHGPKTTYYPSGKVHKEETYREGDLTGVANEYYEDGKLKERSQYAGGKHDGSANTYWPSGKHKDQGGYRQGKKNGLWFFYHGNGMLHMKGQFKDDNQVGPWVYQSALGQPMKDGRYKLETVTVQKKTSTRSNEDGYWNFYRAAGGRSEKVYEIMLSAGMIDGTKEAKVYKDGRLSAKGSFQMGLVKAIFEIQKNGTPAGTILAAIAPPDDFANKITHRWTGEWDAPKKSGKWTYYYPNGKVQAEGEYMVNKKNGEWKVYTPTGALDAEQSGMYRFDRKSEF